MPASHLHKILLFADNSSGVKQMQKKKEIPAGHELRDRPVPPVKGAVTEHRDVLLRPEAAMGLKTAAPEDLTGSDSWL